MLVVTGGAGFIGSNLVAALSTCNKEVVVSDWLGRDERWRNLAKHEIADIVFPEDLLAWLDANESQVDTLIHMGAMSSTVEIDVDKIVRANVRATVDLMDCAPAAKSPSFMPHRPPPTVMLGVASTMPLILDRCRGCDRSMRTAGASIS